MGDAHKPAVASGHRSGHHLERCGQSLTIHLIASYILSADYGESSYIGPIEGDQPNSQSWTNSFPHYGWLKMTRYYANAFKSGAYPAITEDNVYIWSRPHSKDAWAPDYVGRPHNADWVCIYLARHIALH